ncbi:MAG: MptD family putative ECF transporter S component, partial [Blautia wexlerae]
MSSQKKSSRLEGKDLITIGIYTVIYVVIVMLVAMLGFIPIFIPLMAVLCPLIGGIPYMLYVTKAKKFGMTAIMGFMIGLIMVFFGNGYLTMVTGLVGGLLADVILKKADYKSAKSTVLSC